MSVEFGWLTIRVQRFGEGAHPMETHVLPARRVEEFTDGASQYIDAAGIYEHTGHTKSGECDCYPRDDRAPDGSLIWVHNMIQ